MDDQHQPTATRRRARPAIYTAALATGLALGGFGIASAQTDTPGGAEPPAADAARRSRHAVLGRGAIHGEFVVRDRDGEGYRTAVTQRGTVTAASASSLTVESEDGFTETYVVSDQTLVNAGNDGIADVGPGDEVHVRGYAVDGSDDPHAAHIVDRTAVLEIHRHRHRA